MTTRVLDALQPLPTIIEGMRGVLEHLNNCPMPMLAMIQAEIARRGVNLSETPLALTLEFHTHVPSLPPRLCWHAIVNVNMARLTSDIDTSDADPLHAISKALVKLRRELADV